MKGLKTLIKLQKKELDERSRKKAEYEAQIMRLQASVSKLQEDLENERTLIEKMPEMAFMFMNYEESNKKHQQQLQQVIANTQKVLRVLEDEIQINFGELKKFEIALEQKIKKLALKEKLLENKMLDDVAINKHIRKEEE
jgi:hypothetical protein